MTSAFKNDFRGWFTVVIAAVMMVATLPGRTHGLGLITEPMLKSFPEITVEDYATMNLWATLLGSLFCFPAGWCLDRFGARMTTAFIVSSLGVVVATMTYTDSPRTLGWLFFVSRGFGQSALSVASIGLLSRAFIRQSPGAVTAYTVMVGVMFGIAFRSIGPMILQYDWRPVWSTLGWGLMLVGAPLALLAAPTRSAAEGREPQAGDGATLVEALRTGVFWAFACGISLFGFVSSGMGLFYQRILAERGFGATDYYNVMAQGAMIGIASQLACGALLRVFSYRAIFCGALTGYGIAVASLPFVKSPAGLSAYVALIGVSGGALTLVFFGVWKQLFGERHVGRIVGAAQMGTVFASAVGPLYFAKMESRFHSFAQALWIVAAATLLVVLWSSFVKMPSLDREPAHAGNSG